MRELQILTDDYRKSREKLLKSEALMTLSLKASFEAHSAPTLHTESNDHTTFSRVRALCARAIVPRQTSEWPLSVPNLAMHRSRCASTSIAWFETRFAVPSHAAAIGAPMIAVR